MRTTENKPRATASRGVKAAYTSRISPQRRRLLSVLIIFLILVGAIALIVWLVYRPSKPSFSIASVSVYGINTTNDSMITASMQLTVVARNPSRRSGVLYSHLSAYVSYRNQAITMPVHLPVLFQEPGSTVSVSPVVGGQPVPVSPEVSNGLVMDETFGEMALRLVALGKLRWKSGPFSSARYSIYVKCDVLIGIKKGISGQVPLIASPPCSVDI